MARLARTVIPGIPHHVTQRGNGRTQTFFSDLDYEFYLNLLTRHCQAADVSVWAWVLMPNHVHLILTPQDSDGIGRALASASRLCRACSCPPEADRPFLAGPVWLRGHG